MAKFSSVKSGELLYYIPEKEGKIFLFFLQYELKLAEKRKMVVTLAKKYIYISASASQEIREWKESPVGTSRPELQVALHLSP